MAYANEISEELFNSIYDDLFTLATKQQKRIYGKAGKNYYVGECQEKLNDFCRNKMTVLEALEFIKIQKMYQ